MAYASWFEEHCDINVSELQPISLMITSTVIQQIMIIIIFSKNATKEETSGNSWKTYLITAVKALLITWNAGATIAGCVLDIIQFDTWRRQYNREHDDSSAAVVHWRCYHYIFITSNNFRRSMINVFFNHHTGKHQITFIPPQNIHCFPSFHQNDSTQFPQSFLLKFPQKRCILIFI